SLGAVFPAPWNRRCLICGYLDSTGSRNDKVVGRQVFRLALQSKNNEAIDGAIPESHPSRIHIECGSRTATRQRPGQSRIESNRRRGSSPRLALGYATVSARQKLKGSTGPNRGNFESNSGLKRTLRRRRSRRGLFQNRHATLCFGTPRHFLLH